MCVKYRPESAGVKQGVSIHGGLLFGIPACAASQVAEIRLCRGG